VKRRVVCRIAISICIVVLLCAPALPQSSCTQIQPYGQGGFAGWWSQGPGGDANWQRYLAEGVGKWGGLGPICTYTSIDDGNGQGHWYGECHTIAFDCQQAPVSIPDGASETSSGPQCLTGSTPTCGSPINLATGNTYIEQTDLALPGRGDGLKLVRTWNSLLPARWAPLLRGIFGNWRSNYDEKIIQATEDQTFKYIRADGSIWSFQPYGVPAYSPVACYYPPVAPANVPATLMQQGMTNYIIKFDNGEQRVFDFATGELQKIIDRNGNTTQLSYNVDIFDPSIQSLAFVTDAVGRHLYFNYLNGIVTSVTSDFGFTMSYSYNGEILSSITRPDQSTISFTYDQSSNITAVTDSNGKILESHTYDSNGRGLTSSRANGVDLVTITYP
jgi:YD repeat-containing protein